MRLGSGRARTLLAIGCTAAIVAACGGSSRPRSAPPSPTTTAPVETSTSTTVDATTTSTTVAPTTTAPTSQAELAAFAATLPASACLTVSVDGASTVSVRPTTPYAPASNLKLLVASVALARLKPGTRFTTNVVGPAPMNGVVAGNLVLVGGGDPLLATADFVAARGKGSPATSLETLADRVKAAGVRTINGAVLGDDSAFDAQRSVPTWPAHYLSDFEIGPISALDVNDGYAVWGKTNRLSTSPAANAASIFTKLLQARGITVTGAADAGRAPKGSHVVASVSSAPVSSIVGEMLSQSDNDTAEVLLKDVGRSAGLGSTARGIAVEQQYVTLWGLAGQAPVVRDGSGLDPGDRVTCDFLMALLMRAGVGSTLWASLAVAGKTGTIANRFTQAPVAGRLLAKTGTLDSAAALSGVYPTPSGHTIVFSLVMNGPAAQNGAKSEDQLVAALALAP
jgi:D-alanyl-D-alanine carboxypeptidase/D-alanyl-D-alanine-endopeptidase (penicillin-binding protein 4)